MKPGKKFTTFLVLAVFSIFFSVTAEAMQPVRRTDRQIQGNQYTHRQHSNTVGVPLDGGLLALLAGAGIAYFAARKRKKNKE